ncbi:MAG: hypothetical protein BMS9Abin07_2294 [Acidimicrobiia bacterium]|nr:MAG: hypothetical protein BMS9Abin07_2294 [Acidimicrobiia bacterium]
MPKQQQLRREIRRLAKRHGVTAQLVRQGKHEIWECGGLTFSIPRHRDIAEGTARAIIKRLTEHLESLDTEEDL